MEFLSMFGAVLFFFGKKAFWINTGRWLMMGALFAWALHH
jgi:hypothetical protein